jgi:hypothetical protein
MPIHDWSRVRAGIFHDFHQEWIREIKRALNDRVLPPGYYALSEQHAAGFGADELTVQMSDGSRAENDTPHSTAHNGGGLLVAPPPIALTGETEMEFYRREQNSVVIRTAEDDQVIAVVEVVSPGNKSSHHAIDAFANKAAELFDHDIHLLVLDLQRPGPRNPQGIHGVIWGEISDQPYEHPADRPFTLATYECVLAVRAYVKPVAVGEELPEMPLFLQPGAYVLVPLEATYQSALAGVPARWRSVLRQ